jgi:8-oxo-dGTP pyrophosphatase MutT (NUDIX family)
MSSPVRRDTARVIMVDPDDRVLLFRHHLREPWSREGWLLPGGAIDAGETALEAAVRELYEETGHELQLGAMVAFDSGQWQVGGRLHAQHNSYFFARVATTSIDLSGQDDDERADLLEYRWWTASELRTTSDLTFPVELAELLSRLAGGDVPREPLHLPWE